MNHGLILIISIGFILSQCGLSPVVGENEKPQLMNHTTIDPITVTPKIETTTNEPGTTPQLSLTLIPTGHDKENDQLTLAFTGSTAIIDITSPTGIGKAKITTATGHWPQRVIFRLHLQALEGFQVSNGNYHFNYALESEHNAYRYNQAKAGQKLDPIEVEVPPGWLEEAPATLNIQWIDWYR